MVIFVSNYYNHHQAPLSEVLYRLTGGEYRFIATEPMEEERIQMGWGGEEAPFILQYQGNEAACQQLIDSARIVIHGAAPMELLKKRLKEKKLTILYMERIYKEPCPWYKRPIHAVKFLFRFRCYRKLYLLCASAYTAADFASVGTFLGKAYRWGYFPRMKEYDIDALMKRKSENKKLSILWVGRFLVWKRPDAVIRLAKKLKENGYDFQITLVGRGVLEDQIQEMVSQADLQEQFVMPGTMKPEQVREYMERADIYLFTSDRNEGWGAVLNEAMNSACAVVASREIGAVPYLLKHGENGFIYDTENELYQYVKQLMDNCDLRRALGKKAYKTIVTTWNHDCAAERLLQLCDALQYGDSCNLFSTGPCSKE